MHHRFFARAVAGLATALLMLGAVHAKGGGSSHFGPSKNFNELGPIGMASTIVDVDVAGIPSMDGNGSPNNVVLNLDLGAGAWVTGIGWDVGITAYDPSWLSEMMVAFEDSSQSTGVYLTVGAGDNFSGSSSYSSGGIVDLIGLGLDFHVGADGKLRMEFFEGFNDFPDAADGVWDRGTISIQVAAIPEPGTYALMLLGLAGITFVARRRRD